MEHEPRIPLISKTVPEGHTYVQGHYRGIEGTEGQAVYRSRSAMALLFEPAGIDSEPTIRGHLGSDWFEFERAVSFLLEKHFGFSIQHRASRGKTDFGIDILATKSSKGIVETWVVQCKCYKASNPVTPFHMRELIGSMTDVRSDNTWIVRGMMVTTSHFSGEALRIGLKHGIQCIAGDDLNAVLASINAMPDRQSH
jgi:hypothetical protein